MLGHYGESLGVRCARKHLGWYADGLAPSARAAVLRKALLTETRPKEVLRLIPSLFGEADIERAAA
jgi:tRNA-dihydrouridine synthase B